MQTARVSAFRFPNFTSSKFQDPPPPIGTPFQQRLIISVEVNVQRAGAESCFACGHGSVFGAAAPLTVLADCEPKTVVILQLLSSFYKKKRGLLIIKIMLTDTTQYFFVKVVEVFINRENS